MSTRVVIVVLLMHLSLTGVGRSQLMKVAWSGHKKNPVTNRGFFPGQPEPYSSL